MKQPVVSRRLDGLGRIVLPVDMRRKLGAKAGDSFHVTFERDSIVLRLAAPSCALCGCKSHLHPFKERHICSHCLQELNATL